MSLPSQYILIIMLICYKFLLSPDHMTSNRIEILRPPFIGWARPGLNRSIEKYNGICDTAMSWPILDSIGCYIGKYSIKSPKSRS